MSLVGCVTARGPGAADARSGGGGPAAGDRRAGQARGPAQVRPRSRPPPDEPMTSSLLRARLVVFVLEAEARRADAEPGALHPRSRRSPPGNASRRRGPVPARIADESRPEDVQVARGSLRAALDRDGQAYGGVPPELVRSVEERLAALDARMGPPPGPRFQWPLDEMKVTSRFGQRFHPIAHRRQDALRHRPRRRAESAGDGRRCRHRGARRLDARLRLRGHDRPRRRPADPLQPSRPHAGARGDAGGEGDAAGPRRPDRHRHRRAPPLRVLEGRRGPRPAEGLRQAGRRRGAEAGGAVASVRGIRSTHGGARKPEGPGA